MVELRKNKEKSQQEGLHGQKLEIFLHNTYTLQFFLFFIFFQNLVSLMYFSNFVITLKVIDKSNREVHPHF